MNNKKIGDNMSENMTLKEKIFEKIKQNKKDGITTEKIADELNTTENIVNVYLCRDLKDKIKSKGYNKRYKIWYPIEQQSNNNELQLNNNQTTMDNNEKYRENYNFLLHLIELGKIGYNKTITKEDLQKIEEMEIW